jgi:hypothetical protein
VLYRDEFSSNNDFSFLDRSLRFCESWSQNRNPNFSVERSWIIAPSAAIQCTDLLKLSHLSRSRLFHSLLISATEIAALSSVFNSADDWGSEFFHDIAQFLSWDGAGMTQALVSVSAFKFSAPNHGFGVSKLKPSPASGRPINGLSSLASACSAWFAQSPDFIPAIRFADVVSPTDRAAVIKQNVALVICAAVGSALLLLCSAALLIACFGRLRGKHSISCIPDWEIEMNGAESVTASDAELVDACDPRSQD